MQDKNLEYRMQNIGFKQKILSTKFNKLSTCKTKAFTLVELIVTIVILAILTTIAFISFQGYSKNSRDSVRIADINNLEKSLGIFVVKTGGYPVPDNSAEITYAGGTAWVEGIIGETVMRNIDNISKKPTDPLTSNEYTYSITTSKKEYEIGAISEGQELSYNQLPTNKTYAADLNNAVAYMKGNYNEKIIKISTGGQNYVLAIPTIIVTDISNPRIESLLAEKKLVYNNYTNIPHSYNPTSTGGFNYETNRLEVYSGSTINLEDNNNKIDFVKNLQESYSGTILGGTENYQDITNINTATEADKAVDLVNNYITNNVGGISGKITTVTYNNCTLDGTTINHNQTITAYSENSILYGASYDCTDRSEERSCNNGLLTGDDSYQYKSCAKGTPSNCSANSNYTYNTHTYSIPAINHSETATNINSQIVNISNGTQVYKLTSILCNDGILTNETEEISPTVTCDVGYVQDGNNCTEATYTISGDFGTNANGATINVCGTNVTASSTGTFATTRNYGSICNTITATRTNYTCNTITQGPAILTSNTTNIAGSCTANNYTVTFDGNGGSGHTPTSMSVAYNTAIGTLPSNPTRTGFTFNGWYTATSGGTQVTIGTTVLGDATIYAQWSINSYTVIFDGNSGTGHTPTSKSVTYNTAIGSLPTNPTRTGYTFNGWYTSTTGGTQVTINTIITANVTYYAQRIQNTCATQPTYTHASYTTGTPTQLNQARQNTNNTSPCYYTCTDGYTGSDCSYSPLPQFTVNCTASGQIYYTDSSGNKIATVTRTGVATRESGKSISDLTCLGNIVVCSGNSDGYTLQTCNLGTSTINSYGYRYQFGRSDNSWTNGTGTYYYDWKSPGGTDSGSANDWGVLNAITTTATWLNSDSTNRTKMQGPCQAGYHVPTYTEMNGLLIAGGWGSNSTYLMNTLKIPLSGVKGWSSGVMANQGEYGNYWLSSPSGLEAYRFYFSTTTIYSLSSVVHRAQGISVRCFKN